MNEPTNSSTVNPTPPDLPPTDLTPTKPSAINPSSTNPYVGPRTFTPTDADRYYGREREARALIAHVISQRLTVFYAQSGAGKSSIINTRLVPALQERNFAVLPVGRVSGDLPPGIDRVTNIFLFNLMMSMDQSHIAGGEVHNPARFANLPLSDYLARLVSDDGIHYYYDEHVLDELAEGEGTEEEEYDYAEEDYAEDDYVEDDDGTPTRFILIIDQFEEIVTTHLGRWQERTEFFTQLNQAMRDDPTLWIMFSLREDFIAALEPYAHLMDDNMRGRFYMERMGVRGGLDAVRQPAEKAVRPFADGVAEDLVDNLRRIRIQGEEEEQLGQYLEPVQLQAVCYELWENLKDRAPGPIIQTDIPHGYIDQSLTQFYTRALTTVLIHKQVQAAAISERMLRTWFTDELVTQSATRSTVHRNEQSGQTAGMSNIVVDLFMAQFLLRAELRAGDTWIELSHDRFVDPILRANAQWLAKNSNHLTAATQQWLHEDRDPSKLLYDTYLDDAQHYAEQYPNDITEDERIFLTASRQRQEEQARQDRQRRLIRQVALAASLIVIVALSYLTYQARASALAAQTASAAAAAESQRAREALQEAEEQTARAITAEASAANQARVASSRQLAAQAQNELNNFNPDLARLLAIEALNIDETFEAIKALRLVLAEPNATERILSVGVKVFTSAVSPAAEYIATAGERGIIWIWHVATGERLTRLAGQHTRVTALTWSQDSQRLLVVDADGTAQIHDAQTGAIMQSIDYRISTGDDANAGPAVTQAAWSPDNAQILIALTDGRFALLDGAISAEQVGEQSAQQSAQQSAEQATQQAHDGPINVARWHPDGTQILTAGADGFLRLWDAATQTLITEIQDDTAHDQDSVANIVAADWNADANLLVIATATGKVDVWDLDNQRRQSLHGHTAQVTTVAWHPKVNRLLTTSTDQTARIWDALAGKEVALLTGHKGPLLDGAWQNDGAHIVTASTDKTMRVWDAESGDLRHIFGGHTGAINHVVFSLVGDRLWSSSSDGTVRQWRIALANQPGGELPILIGHTAAIHQARWSQDSRHILTVSNDGTGRVWDAATGTTVHTLIAAAEEPVTHGRWRPDEEAIALAAHDGTVTIWDATTGQQQQSHAIHARAITQLWWGKDGTRILSSSEDGTINVWDATTGNVTLQIGGADRGPFTNVRWNQSESQILSTDLRGAQVWDAATGEQRLPLTTDRPTYFAAWDAQEAQIVTTGDDGAVIIWDAQTGAELESLSGHSGRVNSADWRRNGLHLVTAGDDNTARFWELPAVQVLEGHTQPVNQALWNRDETHILTASADGTARIWEAINAREQARMTGHESAVTFARWNADESRILTASTDGTARQFFTDINQLRITACASALRNMTLPEWLRAFPDAQYRSTCAELPPG